MAFFLQSAAMLPLMGVIYGIGHSIMYPLISALFVNSGHDGERLSLNNLFSAVNQFGGIAAARGSHGRGRGRGGGCPSSSS